LTNNQTIEINNVTFDRILYYCNKIRTSQQNYWNLVDWYKEGNTIEVPGNFTIVIDSISENAAQISVHLPSGSNYTKTYTINDQFKDDGVEFIVLNISENSVQLNISSNQTTGYTFWSTYWEKIYQGIEESGLCELLKKGNESSEGEIVSNALKYTNVKVEFTYIRKTYYESQSIRPYTRTEKCIELEKQKA
jgi:sRNA-binding carbon storage regulator CsrA